MTPVSDWEAKITRARFHRAVLDDRLKSLLDSKRLGTDVETSADARTYVVRLRQLDPLPIELSLILGDALHNLRSALDCMPYALAGRPPLDDGGRKTQFPICRSPKEFAEQRWRLGRASDEAVAAVRRVQPFALTEELEGDFSSTINLHPLWRLGELSNTDKHRTLHLATLVLDLAPALVPSGIQPDWTWGSVANWGDGSEIGRWTIPEDQPVLPIEVIPTVFIGLVGDGDSPFAGRSVTKLLDELVQFVDWRVLPEIGAELPG